MIGIIWIGYLRDGSGRFNIEWITWIRYMEDNGEHAKEHYNKSNDPGNLDSIQYSFLY